MQVQKNENIFIKCNNEFFEISDVKVIKSLIISSITRVPFAKPVIAGLINFEGNIIPLLNFSNNQNFLNENKSIVVDSENGIFAITGELLLIKKISSDIKKINYKTYF